MDHRLIFLYLLVEYGGDAGGGDSLWVELRW
jgi:hypothetical protein